MSLLVNERMNAELTLLSCAAAGTRTRTRTSTVVLLNLRTSGRQEEVVT